MSVDDLYEFTVEWPEASSKTVIVTGDFDQWSKSLPLIRSSTGIFSTTIKVPYGCPIRYKFVVDGEWKVSKDQPTENTDGKYLNNVHYVPAENPNAKLASEPPVSSNGAAAGATTSDEGKAKDISVPLNGEAREQGVRSTPTSAMPQSISNLANTMAARDGTSSILGYVASGIGAAIHSVVGVDPINPNQIAIQTPISPTPSGLPSATDTRGILDAHTPGSESPIAPIVPITIVPVYAKENCTIDPKKATPEVESPGFFFGVGNRRAMEDNVEEDGTAEHITGELGASTHAPVVPPIPVIVTSEPSPTSPPGHAGGESAYAVEVPTIVPQGAPDLAAVSTIIAEYEAEKESTAVADVTEDNSDVAPGTGTPIPSGTGQVDVEKIPVAEKDNREEKLEKDDAVQATTPAPDPEQIPFPETSIKSPAGTNANGHYISPSSGTTTSNNINTPASASSSSSSSSPSTPTPTAAKSSSPSRSRYSTLKKKVLPSLGHGSSPSKDEEGNGTTASGRKKRTSSIFGSLKNLFHHHDSHDKKDEKDKKEKKEVGKVHA